MDSETQTGAKNMTQTSLFSIATRKTVGSKTAPAETDNKIRFKQKLNAFTLSAYLPMAEKLIRDNCKTVAWFNGLSGPDQTRCAFNNRFK